MGYALKHGEQFTVEISPNERFKQEYPTEAHYFFNLVEVYLIHDGPPQRCGGASCGINRNKLTFPVPSIPMSNPPILKYLYDFTIVRQNSAKVLCPVELHKSESSFTFVVKR